MLHPIYSHLSDGCSYPDIRPSDPDLRGPRGPKDPFLDTLLGGRIGIFAARITTLDPQKEVISGFKDSISLVRAREEYI